MLTDNLRAEGYSTEVATSAEDALMLPIDEYSLLISEVDLPGEIDGYDLLEHIKDDHYTAHVPLMFCTLRDSENDIIRGLNLGADDFISRPFSLREMMARVRSVLRRHRNLAPAVNRNTVEFGTLILNVASRGLLIDGESVSLSPTEFSILTLLMRGRNRLFSREEIFESAWPGEKMENPRLVDVNISRLRKKLGQYARNVVNKSGLGYGFLDKV